jgi:hypothetical protein
MGPIEQFGWMRPSITRMGPELGGEARGRRIGEIGALSPIQNTPLRPPQGRIDGAAVGRRYAGG